jgi:hypothetical protein
MMLWYKSWLETRWRFVIGFAVMFFSAAGAVIAYPEMMRLLPLGTNLDLGGEIGRRVNEAVELSRSFRGYVWAQVFRQNLTQHVCLFAVVLGTGGLLSQAAAGGGALFTLSMPATRDRVLGVRAATGLAELFVLAVVPSLLLPLFSVIVGEQYGVTDALVHGVCMFIAGTVLFSLAFLLSTVFSDVWTPALIALGVAFVLALVEQVPGPFARVGLFRVMSGEAYFRGAGVPWIGLLASLMASAALLFAAMRNMARRDF